MGFNWHQSLVVINYRGMALLPLLLLLAIVAGASVDSGVGARGIISITTRMSRLDRFVNSSPMSVSFVTSSWEVLEVQTLILSRMIRELATWLLVRPMVIAIVMFRAVIDAVTRDWIMEEFLHALLAVVTDMSRVGLTAFEGDLTTGIRKGSTAGGDRLFEFGVLLQVRCWRLHRVLHVMRHRSRATMDEIHDTSLAVMASWSRGDAAGLGRIWSKSATGVGILV